ncbi:MAG: MvaI/BcnI restriction endonuclease family protein [Phycisphaerales bacterium]|nr:MvaI/BcnI restriction endonuclease family protein [Phycisphaerales bacterium]
MNTRQLNQHESDNLAVLNNAGSDSALLFLTETGMGKSILDATAPMRRLLCNSGVHDYERQSKGETAKVCKPAVVITESALEPTTVSFYRPTTKCGDPRLWVYKLKSYAKPNDVCAVLVRNDRIHLLNLSRSSLATDMSHGLQSCATQVVEDLASMNCAASRELLARLRNIAAAGPIRAQCSGDTAIGRSVEAALGIPINSSRAPDFMGIEIKSGRSPENGDSKTRATLFACVPDWKLSKLTSSRAILAKFGYSRGGAYRLYCTMTTRRMNAQGLQLKVIVAESRLREYCARIPEEDVCTWQLDRLHERLTQKHRETFWIKAKPFARGGHEWFELISVVHTSRPSVLQFDRLLVDGTITIDHLIKRKPCGNVSEKGPLFKIERSRIGELFLGKEHRHRLQA